MHTSSLVDGVLGGKEIKIKIKGKRNPQENYCLQIFCPKGITHVSEACGHKFTTAAYWLMGYWILFFFQNQLFINWANWMPRLLLSGGQWSSHHHRFRSWCDEGCLCQNASPFLHQAQAPAPYRCFWASPPASPHLHDANLLRKQH